MKVEPASYNDQLLRQTRIHHVQLSVMADNKANILITIASLVVTFTLPQFTHGTAGWPQMVLVAGSVITVLLAAWAIMPRIRPQNANLTPSMRSPDVNLLFFGDFVSMKWEDYEAAMEEMLNDPNLAYEAKVKEIYLMGQYLAHKKYRFLRFAYLSFLTGIATGGLGMLLQHSLR